ncbi:hypothetical protein ACF061_26735 [Streptomyces sp. NPDC015220]|uniref:hypothetical protein n=1 Tax=Streptomyces sp. NPDC015220 TaxID=3364947 RepID=UPI0036FAF1D0
MARTAAPQTRPERTTEHRHELRSAASTLANAARRLAAELDAEATRRQPAGPRTPAPPTGQPPTGHTRAALDILHAARHLVMAAVTADRTARDNRTAIPKTLTPRLDAASRRYRGATKSRSSVTASTD